MNIFELNTAEINSQLSSIIKIEKEASYDILYQKEVEGVYDILSVGKLFGILTDVKLYLLATSDSTILKETTSDSTILDGIPEDS